jgi:hypothetical protein
MCFKDDCIIDSGCTSHMTGNLDLFENYELIDESIEVQVVVRKGGKGDVEKLKEVYVDTLGPMQCESLLGNRYRCYSYYRSDIKKDSHGNFLKCKARSVARGSQQEEGRDFNEIFSPVVKTESIRFLLAFAAVEDFEIHQIDIRSAFLHGQVVEDIYLYAPEGAGFREGTVLKLNKSLYGIKQAPRVFYEMVKDHLRGTHHYQCSHSNNNTPHVVTVQCRMKVRRLS